VQACYGFFQEDGLIMTMAHKMNRRERFRLSGTRICAHKEERNRKTLLCLMTEDETEPEIISAAYDNDIELI
jgi:hypothetical protein